jgi:hypothetical protein
MWATILSCIESYRSSFASIPGRRSGDQPAHLICELLDIGEFDATGSGVSGWGEKSALERKNDGAGQTSHLSESLCRRSHGTIRRSLRLFHR